MAGNRCEYFNCGKNARNIPGIHLYLFPKNEERQKQWILNSGNAHLAELSPKTLSKRFICRDHFEESAFSLPTRKKLRPDALPVSYTKQLSPSYLRVKTPTKTYPAVSTSFPSSSSCPTDAELSPHTTKWLSEISDLPLTPTKTEQRYKRKLFRGEEDDTPRKKLLRQGLIKSRKTLKNRSTYISKLKKNVFRFKYLSSKWDSVVYSSAQSRTLVRMQTMHKARQPWHKDEKQLALALYYKSPSAYKFLRKQKIILPSVSTIRHWIGLSSFEPGYSKKFIQQLTIKVSTMLTHEKACVLCFDEMALKQMLEYSKAKDFIEGFQDLGSLGRKPNLANHALVFLARGLYSKWKLPIAYFVSENGVKADDLTKLILETVTQVFNAGLYIKAVICDQGSSNRKALKILGATATNPYFHIDNKTIYSIFDAPHLFKSIRNNLLSGHFLLNGKSIMFKDIVDTYIIDKRSQTSRALVKLTDSHINPNPFQKMSCRLALQVLSHSVASAIRTCVKTGELKNSSALDTSDFIEIMDRLFDSLNSRQRFSKNPYNNALSETSTHVKNILLEGLEIMKTIEKVNTQGRISRPPCFDGFVWTITAVLKLFEDEKQNEYSYLLTARLNQDILENLFSIFRQRGGYNRNPTVRTLRTSFRINIVTQLIKVPESANCEPDDDVHLNLQRITTDETITSEEPSTISENISESSSSSSTSVSVPSASQVSVQHQTQEQVHSSLEECSITYFAGYLVKKCIDKFNCKLCLESLLCPTGEKLKDPRELLILNKNYAKQKSSSISLTCPSEEVTEICKISLLTFNKMFNKIKEQTNVRKKIVTEVKNKIQVRYSKWFQESHCQVHQNYIIDHLVTTKLFRHCKWLSSLKKSKITNTKMHPKLRILKNQ